MKIITATFVFNDWEYLDQAISSLKNFGDKHYIIEGSWQSAQKSAGVGQRSNQLTYDVINKHVDNKRVFLIQANEPLERDQRQVGLEIAKQEKADWFFMQDADEVYTRQNLLKVQKTLERQTGGFCRGFRLNSYNFINSFKKWYNGNYMRIYQPTKSGKFIMDNDATWNEPGGFIGAIPGYSFWHYSYVRLNAERFYTMMKYQNYQDPTFNTRVLPQYGYNEAKKTYKIPDDIPIYDFTGKHPKIMANHPYFINDVFNDGPLEFLNE